MGILDEIALNAQAQGAARVQGAVQGVQTQVANTQQALQAASTPQAEAAREQATADGIQAVINGKRPSDSQVEAAATTAAVVGTSIALGVSLAAAGAALGPIGVVVFGLGTIMDVGIQAGLRALGWMKSNVACSHDDPTVEATGPDDPRWRHYPPDNGYGATYIAASSGTFENWARPIVAKMLELSDNCRQLPAPNWQALAQGVVATWNSHAPPGTPMRTIAFHMAPGQVDDPSGKAYDVRGSTLRDADPIQQLIKYAYAADERNGPTPAITNDVSKWSIQVADPPMKKTIVLNVQGVSKLAGLAASKATAAASKAANAPEFPIAVGASGVLGGLLLAVSGAAPLLGLGVAFAGLVGAIAIERAKT